MRRVLRAAACHGACTVPTAPHRTQSRCMTYQRMVVQGGRMEDLVRLPDAPPDLSQIYNDWVCSQQKVTDDVMGALLTHGVHLAGTLPTPAQRVAVIRQIAEVYAFAEEDMLVVPTSAGELFVQCCVLVDEHNGGDIGMRTAHALYSKLLKEKQAKPSSTRFSGALVAAMTRMHLKQSDEQRLLRDAEDCQVLVDALRHRMQLRYPEHFAAITSSLPQGTALLLLQQAVHLGGSLSQTVSQLIAKLHVSNEPCIVPEAFDTEQISDYITKFCGPDVLSLLVEVLERVADAAPGAEQPLIEDALRGLSTAPPEGDLAALHDALERRAFAELRTLKDSACQKTSGFASALLQLHTQETGFKAVLEECQGGHLPVQLALGHLAAVADKKQNKSKPMSAKDQYLAATLRWDKESGAALSQRVLEKGGHFPDDTLKVYLTMLLRRGVPLAAVLKELRDHSAQAPALPLQAHITMLEVCHARKGAGAEGFQSLRDKLLRLNYIVTDNVRLLRAEQEKYNESG